MNFRHQVLLLTPLLLFILAQPCEQKVKSEYRAFAAVSPDFSKREEAYRTNNLGVALLEQYKAHEAAAEFTRALGIDQKLAIARINLSIALYYVPDTEGARREAEKALAQQPNAPQAHYILGLVARAQNRLPDAVVEFHKVLEIDPTDVGTNVNLGQVYVQQKEYTEAIAALRVAIGAEPYNLTALYNLGILFTRTGQKEEGQKLIQKFQQLRESGSGTSISTNYLEGGRYAEAVVSTGIEPDLVDRAMPDVKFVDATGSALAAEHSGGARIRQKRNRRPHRRQGMWGPWDEGARNGIASSLRSGVTLFDFDNDDDLDLVELTDDGPRLLRNDNGRFVDVTAQSGALDEEVRAVPIVAAAGDYDNDGRPDLLVVRYGRISLYHNDGNGRFSDRTKEARIPEYPYLAISAAFVDVDHDGDLDIFIAGFADLSQTKFKPFLGKDSPLLHKGFTLDKAWDPFQFALNLPGAPNMLLRNNGNGTFTNITADAKVSGSAGHAVAVVPTDYDNRRDVDLLVVNYGLTPDLFSNQRDGSFRNLAKEVGLDVEGKWTCVAAGDLNKDGFTDFFFGRADGPGLFAISDGKGKLKTSTAPSETRSATAAQFIDYDNDGLLDSVIVTDSSLLVLRNVGNGWVNVSDRAIPDDLRGVAKTGLRPSLASADLDSDGDSDLVVHISNGNLRVLRNDGGNRNRSIRVNLHGRVSNRSAVQAKIEVRAGSLWQKLETYSASPAPAPADVVFGLGKRDAADAVRILWPAGIVQAETEIAGSGQTAGRGGKRLGFVTINITELDRKPSSCPYLYTWNGERFEFVTDFMGGGEMGYLEERGRYNRPDPDEYVRIRADQLREWQGRYELRVTNELEEALLVDRLQLLVVAHPSGTEVYPNEGMSDPPRPFRLFVTHGAHPPLTAVDDHRHDVLDRIAYLDRRYADDFKVDRVRGYAAKHTLTLNLDRQTLDIGHWALDKGKEPLSQRIVLLLTGWTDYAWSSDNVAAAQGGKSMKPPELQVRDEKGIWKTVIKDIGIPVGRPQTVTVDLTGRFLSANRDVRIVTNMRIYWDQILVDVSDGRSAPQIAKLDPVAANLHWRGFSRATTPDGREPFGYDYKNVSFTSPWKVMVGGYTREGDVRELLLKSDDMFVICKPGDELSLSFDANALPALPEGWTRTFLLYADGFSKEMDINSASPDQIAPLPFHGMSKYPFSWPEHYPLMEERRAYIEKYNTRIVTSYVARAF